METSRQSPIFRIGISDIPLFRWCGGGLCPIDDDLARASQRERKGAGHGRLGDNVQLQSKVYNRLRNLWADATEDAIRTHQACCRDRLDQMLSNQRVHGGH